MARLRTLLVAGATGATAAYFLDPALGATRRARARDRSMALLRRGERRVERAGRKVASDARGLRERAANRAPAETMPTDPQLKDKIESEVLGPQGIHGVLVNVEEGVVVLHGELDDERRIERLVKAIRAVAGTEDVRNLIHLPGAPAPNKAAARQASDQAKAPATGNGNG